MVVYICKLCGKHFKQKSHYDKHVLNKKIPCDINTRTCSSCGKVFIKASYVSTHIKTCKIKNMHDHQFILVNNAVNNAVNDAVNNAVNVVHNAVDDAVNDINNNGCIYLLIEREFIKTNENIYKIGRTKRKIQQRLQGYPKGSKLIIYRHVSNTLIAERQLMAEFCNNFIQCKHIGNEYFSGDMNKMIEILETIAKNKFVHEGNKSILNKPILNKPIVNDFNKKNVNKPIINNFGKEDLSKYTYEELFGVLSRGSQCHDYLLTMIHFNEKYPENQNIILDNISSGIMRVKEDDVWVVRFFKGYYPKIISNIGYIISYIITKIDDIGGIKLDDFIHFTNFAKECANSTNKNLLYNKIKINIKKRAYSYKNIKKFTKEKTGFINIFPNFDRIKKETETMLVEQLGAEKIKLIKDHDYKIATEFIKETKEAYAIYEIQRNIKQEQDYEKRLYADFESELEKIEILKNVIKYKNIIK